MAELDVLSRNRRQRSVGTPLIRSRALFTRWRFDRNTTRRLICQHSAFYIQSLLLLSSSPSSYVLVWFYKIYKQRPCKGSKFTWLPATHPPRHRVYGSSFTSLQIPRAVYPYMIYMYMCVCCYIIYAIAFVFQNESFRVPP